MIVEDKHLVESLTSGVNVALEESREQVHRADGYQLGDVLETFNSSWVGACHSRPGKLRVFKSFLTARMS